MLKGYFFAMLHNFEHSVHMSPFRGLMDLESWILNTEDWTHHSEFLGRDTHFIYVCTAAVDSLTCQ